METLRGNCAHARFCLFKSYYVVWKLYFSGGKNEASFCLNRTM